MMQPPICKEGDVIKEGQVIGFLDQFGTELPVKSDVAGEVIKLLFNDGEALVPIYGRGKTSSDPRFRSIPGEDIPHRPAGQKPETAPPPAPDANYFRDVFQFGCAVKIFSQITLLDLH
ncbi:unnamed protein product [Camellia sinensis]